MSEISNFIKGRKIEEVLHFSTNHGLVGIASIGQVISRDQLEVDPENDPKSPLFALNAKNSKFRSDPEWTSYINLSISRINTSFLGFSRNWRKKDPDHYWIILAFKPDILEHQDVFFSTTNNIYHSSCIRKQGIEGLQNCFSNCVISKHNQPIDRPANYPSFWTTCQEAEVLYFKSLSLDYLKCIYVEDEGTYDQVVTTLHALTDRTDINVIINKSKFEGQ
ncbi:DarT ssDNA thymidine ADP-ribosyltransferase family protein [Photobacterium leiognathi]|uniref:DarT ssDNA thymidine ADP-ribosyltransferase family protein n=1 Tax=Photobacterium leiognathi TaxID=553611 RepID=UPI002981CE8E|nr:DarT ssDNA thymidine ADP-ribosyltransferase family protein [Photobacterium leiognathi]